MLTLLIFIIVISLLVVVHELGHFWAAKRAGMKVEEFGFGFPPRLWGRRGKDGTLYSINAIPFGGFVRILGEDGEQRGAPGSFGHATFGRKLVVLVAGVVMNFLFAAVLLVGAHWLGLRVGIFDEQMASRASDKKVQILAVSPDSPAQEGGLLPLDQIRGFRVQGVLEETDSPEEVQAYAFSHAGEDTVMAVRREKSDIDVPLKLRQPVGPSEGPIGISLALTGIVRYPWYESVWRGFATAGSLFAATLYGFWFILSSLFTDGRIGVEIAGPVGIASLTGQAARIGFNYLLQFVALISVNLAVLNILPFPALDGGRVVMVLAERLRGRALSQRLEEVINALGFAVLLSLMVAVTIKDIVKFF